MKIIYTTTQSFPPSASLTYVTGFEKALEDDEASVLVNNHGVTKSQMN